MIASLDFLHLLLIALCVLLIVPKTHDTIVALIQTAVAHATSLIQALTGHIGGIVGAPPPAPAPQLRTVTAATPQPRDPANPTG
jgi:hypothetical protein